MVPTPWAPPYRHYLPKRFTHIKEGSCIPGLQDTQKKLIKILGIVHKSSWCLLQSRVWLGEPTWGGKFQFILVNIIIGLSLEYPTSAGGVRNPSYRAPLAYQCINPSPTASSLNLRILGYCISKKKSSKNSSRITERTINTECGGERASQS